MFVRFVIVDTYSSTIMHSHFYIVFYYMNIYTSFWLFPFFVLKSLSQRYCWSFEDVFFFSLFLLFLFVLVFITFTMKLPRCGLLCIYPVWSSQGFLNLWLDAFISVETFSAIISSSIASTPFFSVLLLGVQLHVTYTFS